MENLKKLKLDKYLKKLSKKKKNFGYLFRNAIINLFIERISFYKGLEIIEGKFEYLKSHNIGWSKLNFNKKKIIPLKKCRLFFFQHNMKYIGPKKNIHAFSKGFENPVSIIRKNNTIGVQFHPEKSQLAGHNFLKFI